MISLDNLTVSYGGWTLFDNISFLINEKDRIGLVGKNGAGKTTLIRLICGLQAPTSGDYTLYGVKNTDPKVVRSRRRMGAVVETPSIYMDMTAEENLKQQYLILGLPSFDSIPELLKLVGLENAEKKKARNFSLGMRQRLGIAIALAGDPDLLVLDEPTNGLDPQGIIEMRELILKLNRQRNITVIMSSHILDELARLATHYGFIDGGRMLREISAEELEAACRKCLRVEVSDVGALTRVLDAKGIEYKVISDTKADIYAKMSITELAAALAGESCELLGVTEKDESLESYYVNLVGGDRHD